MSTDTQRPIDKKRTSGYVDVGYDVDGAIIDMFAFDEKLYAVKSRAIYVVMNADSIDPERTNISIPAYLPRKTINLGSDSALVCRTYLTARRLFDNEHLRNEIDYKRALVYSFEALQELAELDMEISKYLDVENEEIRKHQALQVTKNRFELPTIPNVHTRCATIFQKAEHVMQILMEMAGGFYPEDKFTKNIQFPTFHEFIKKKYGEDDPFVTYIGKTLKVVQLVRDIRNCLDHRLADAVIYNFDMQSDSSILAPGLSIKYRGSNMDRTDLSTLLPEINESFVAITEQLILHLSIKNMKANGIAQIRFIPESERRRYQYAQYGYWFPFGDNGFTQQ
jgi:hypothetical protein